MCTKLTNSSAQMKPTVPHIRMGGKVLTVSIPALVRALKATELFRPMVGMKKATLQVYSAKRGPNSMSLPACIAYQPAAIMNPPASTWHMLKVFCAGM